MSMHLSKEIQKLKKMMSELCSIVEESMKKAVYSVINHDTEVAQEVIDNDNIIDEMEIELEEECLKILALHQPVAVDLRYVIACMKMNNDLERIGDLSANIAKSVKYISVMDYTTNLEQEYLFGMMTETQGMLKNSLDALFDMNAELAEKVCIADDIVDDFNAKNHVEITKNIQKYPERTPYFLKLLGVSRNIERIADYATNIAEDIIYMINGNIVRHQ